MTRVLIVEDNPVTQTALAEFLESHGLEVDYAGNGLGAIVRLGVYPAPDLLITDQLMPAMGGVQLLEKIREGPATAHLPVIVITAMADGPELEEKKRRIDALPPAALLRKPFEMVELLMLIGRMVRKPVP